MASTSRTAWARRERPPSATSTASLPVALGHFRLLSRWRPIGTWRVSIGALLLLLRRRRPTSTWGVPVSITLVAVPVATCVAVVPVSRRSGTGVAACVLAVPVIRRSTSAGAGNSVVVEKVPVIAQDDDGLERTMCAVPVALLFESTEHSCEVVDMFRERP